MADVFDKYLVDKDGEFITKTEPDTKGVSRGPIAPGSVGRYAVPAFKTAGGADDWDKYLYHPEKDESALNDPKLRKAQEAVANNPFNFMRSANIPGAATMEDVVNPSLMKGILGVRHHVPQSENLSVFEETHPWASKGLQAAGTVGSMIAPSTNIAMRTPQTFGQQFAGQLALNAPMNLLDASSKALKQGQTPTKDELSKALMNATAESAIPAAFSRTFGQSPRLFPGDEGIAGRIATNRARAGMISGGHMTPAEIEEQIAASHVGPHMTFPHQGAAAGISDEAKRHLSTVLSTAAGGYLGHKFAGEAMMGMLAGGGLSEAARYALGGLGERIGPAFRHPSTQDILRALAQQGTTNTQPPQP
jgi:hypothetical protein